MPHRFPRSLRHEYELYVEREIENYKESVPRSALLKVGDEAIASMERQQQLALTEILLCEEVDRIIRQRLRLPSYATWRKRRVKELAELRRPERWGLRPEDPLVMAVPPSDGHVLVAGAAEEGSALYLAANGCDVTTIHQQPHIVERVLVAAEAAGLTERVHGEVGDLTHWAPEGQLSAVICAREALEGLTFPERAKVIARLQGATATGGVHLVEAAPNGVSSPTLEELRNTYRGWDIFVERQLGSTKTFVARKAIA